MRHFKVVLALMIAGALMFAVGPAQADNLPDNCDRDHGTVTCTEFDGPGNNQAGVGTTTTDETQGNTKNTSPEPQDLESSESCKPPKSQGAPCNP